MNLAHDVERPLRFGDWLCDCHGCRTAAEAHARAYPTDPLVIKRSQGRDVITFADWIAAGQDATRWHAGPTDYVREMFVGDRGSPITRARFAD